MALNEDTLVQQTTADYLRDALRWRSEYAYNTDVLGAEGSFGRRTEHEVVLTRILGEKSIELNPACPTPPTRMRFAEHFHNWKRLEEAEPGVVDVETLLRGVCDKRNFLDLFENFILFDDVGDRSIKIVVRNNSPSSRKP